MENEANPNPDTNSNVSHSSQLSQPDAKALMANRQDSIAYPENSEFLQSGAADVSILHLNEDDNDFLIELINGVIDRLDQLDAKVDRVINPEASSTVPPDGGGVTVSLTRHELDLLAQCNHNHVDCPGSWRVRILPTRTGRFLSVCCTENCVVPKVISDDP